MDLYQAEWCPDSHRVRQRLTELGVDVTIRQVAVDPERRDELVRLTGDPSIPVLVPEGLDPIRGGDEILAYLSTRYEERPDAGDHRARAQETVREFEELATQTKERS